MSDLDMLKRKKPNRFDAFDPEEREILRVLLQNCANTVSEISCALEIRTAAFTMRLEALLAEEAGE